MKTGVCAPSKVAEPIPRQQLVTGYYNRLASVA